MIEKRFTHLKTDFAVAPVFLKEVSRIQGLLCMYFFALLVESLLERELRKATDPVAPPKFEDILREMCGK
jgi:transposase